MTTSVRSRPIDAAAACLVAALGPPAAWLASVSWADGKASDAAHAAWFLSVALTTLLAGVLAPAGRATRVAASGLAAVSVLTTLWLWWSTSDDSGLFVIGFVMWFLPVLLAAPVLVGVGGWIRWSTRWPG